MSYFFSNNIQLTAGFLLPSVPVIEAILYIVLCQVLHKCSEHVWGISSRCCALILGIQVSWACTVIIIIIVYYAQADVQSTAQWHHLTVCSVDPFCVDLSAIMISSIVTEKTFLAVVSVFEIFKQFKAAKARQDARYWISKDWLAFWESWKCFLPRLAFTLISVRMSDKRWVSEQLTDWQIEERHAWPHHPACTHCWLFQGMWRQSLQRYLALQIHSSELLWLCPQDPTGRTMLFEFYNIVITFT